MPHLVFVGSQEDCWWQYCKSLFQLYITMLYAFGSFLTKSFVKSFLLITEEKPSLKPLSRKSIHCGFLFVNKFWDDFGYFIVRFPFSEQVAKEVERSVFYCFSKKE